MNTRKSTFLSSKYQFAFHVIEISDFEDAKFVPLSDESTVAIHFELPNSRSKVAKASNREMPTTTTTEGSKEGKSKEFGWKTLPNDLAVLSFYFGFLPRDAVEVLLKNDGNYAVWGQEREGGSLYCYILAVQTKTGKVRHLNLNLTGREQYWTVELMKDAEQYRGPTITELVSALHQKVDGISFTDGSEAVKLVQSVKRPSKLFCECKELTINPNKRLGEGNFCNVVFGTMVTLAGAGKKVAIKAFKEAMPDATEDQIVREQKELFMEARTLSRLHHPNIIVFLGIDCFRPPIKISVGERLLYLFEVARGMHYLEQKEVIHRDLAARNCLISIDSTIRIADFGLSITKKAAEHERCQKLRVPIRQMAPETIGRQPHFSSKSDVFTDGQKPWIDEEVKLIAKNIKERKMPTLPANTPPEVVEVLASCWELEIEKRPSFRQLAEITSKHVQDPKFALPSISARTICVHNLLFARKSDDFEIEPAVRNHLQSVHPQTETQKSPENRRGRNTRDKTRTKGRTRSKASMRSLQEGRFRRSPGGQPVKHIKTDDANRRKTANKPGSAE
ncbi:Tyrosine-protein kinase [Aphelenchoides besseyi]|nr:Tyrosine-protein kinase [Aphelenchoides besseyi]